ncbi:MAG: epoxyqueuosine reductase [Planctomycetota bacterium]|nr:MAG: epoxyqueuosine reductase [Planctomycetota bacterium]
MTFTVDIALRERVRARLLERGFAQAGFADATPVSDHVGPWVAAGRHAGMQWIEREPERRNDPTTLLPGAASVICVAASYPAQDGSQAVAAYACAEDYHHDLRAALEEVAAELRAWVPGAGTRVCVDSAPLSERAFAARAGLGWIGRNTMLLNERLGPWMLLAEILVDAHFPPDAPAAFRCGSCTACVDACPTDALDGKGQLDAGRCLSYWSIEHRGELPEAWGAALGHRAFGCDDCLAACPFPAQEAAPSSPPLRPRPELAAATPARLRELAEASFKRHLGSTPLERARKGGLLRNLSWVERNSPAR